MPGKYRPLEAIKEGPKSLFTVGRFTTIMSTVYTGDIKAILETYPDGSVHFDAAMLHEQVHSRRQWSYSGTPVAWFFLYAFIPSFRWEEEKAGWSAEITRLVMSGYRINRAVVAQDLSSNYSGPFDNGMVTFGEAYLWISLLVESLGQR